MTILFVVDTGTIDRRAHLSQLGVQAFAGAFAFITRSWLPLALAGAVFAVSAFAWPRLAPVVQVYDRVIAPRLRTTPWTDDPRPARVSTSLAAVSLLGASAAVATGYGRLVWPGMPFLVGALGAEIAVGACVPCEIVVWAIRRGWLRPEPT